MKSWEKRVFLLAGFSVSPLLSKWWIFTLSWRRSLSNRDKTENQYITVTNRTYYTKKRIPPFSNFFKKLYWWFMRHSQWKIKKIKKTVIFLIYLLQLQRNLDLPSVTVAFLLSLLSATANQQLTKISPWLIHLLTNPY